MLTDADVCWQRVLHFVYFPHEQRGAAAHDWRHYGPGTLLALLVRCDHFTSSVVLLVKRVKCAAADDRRHYGPGIFVLVKRVNW
jgi:hypothetical protein